MQSSSLWYVYAPALEQDFNDGTKITDKNADDSDFNENAGDTELQQRNTLERRRSKNSITDAFHQSMDSLYSQYEILSDSTGQLPAKQMQPSCLRRSQLTHEEKSHASPAPGKNIFSNTPEKQKLVSF